MALQPGGGETYPIYLSNEMHRLGYSVTLLDMNMQGYDEAIRNLLHPQVPLVRLRSLDELVPILLSLECDIVHTHHGSVDYVINGILQNTGLSCKHVITLHGMYESVEESECYIRQVHERCSRFIYIADKNLVPFQSRGLYSRDKSTKISNGLPDEQSSAILSRSDFGIPKGAFVYCLASRGLKAKGWKEAVEAVNYANTYMNVAGIH